MSKDKGEKNTMKKADMIRRLKEEIEYHEFVCEFNRKLADEEQDEEDKKGFNAVSNQYWRVSFELKKLLKEFTSK